MGNDLCCSNREEEEDFQGWLGRHKKYPVGDSDREDLRGWLGRDKKCPVEDSDREDSRGWLEAQQLSSRRL